MDHNDPAEPAQTRHSLHAIAEVVLAGPQHRRSGTIRLRVTPGGFATVAEPELRVQGSDLVVGERRVPLHGASLLDLAEAAGVDAGAPAGLYHDGSGATADDIALLDPATAAMIAAWLERGDAAMRYFAPDQTPVLWPEHFDLGISKDEVNYGVSPGDAHHVAPYAYVGPFTARQGEFWNAPFGASRPATDLPDVPALVAFFEAGRAAARG